MSKKNKLFKQQAKKDAEHSAQLQYGADWEIAIKRHECGDFIAKAMFKLVKRTNDPYMDNFRWTEVGDLVGEKLYANAVKHGCCGFTDEVVCDPKTGRRFKIGFNFGH